MAAAKLSAAERPGGDGEQKIPAAWGPSGDCVQRRSSGLQICTVEFVHRASDQNRPAGARVRSELLDLEGDSLASDQLREQTVRRGPQDDPFVQHRVADRQDLRAVGCGPGDPASAVCREKLPATSPGDLTRHNRGCSLLRVELMNSVSGHGATHSSLEPGKALDQRSGLPASTKSPGPAGGVEGCHDRDEGVDEVVVDSGLVEPLG